MMNILRRNLDGFRGTLRLEDRPAAKKETQSKAGFHLSADLTDADQDASTSEAPWLKESRKLIPGEALAGYLSLQALANPKIADDPRSVKIFLAIVFCLVTILLRWLGTQSSKAADPVRSVQWSAIVISTLSYIFLVYSTGGQIFWHNPVKDQQLYAQILSVALGILGPTIYRALPKS